MVYYRRSTCYFICAGIGAIIVGITILNQGNEAVAKFPLIVGIVSLTTGVIEEIMIQSKEKN